MPVENTRNVLPIHLTGMENLKGQQAINSILDTMNKEIDNHKWIVTTQDYANLKFEKFLESGSTLTIDQKPKNNVPIIGTHNNRKVYIGDLDVQGNIIVKDLTLRDNINQIVKSWEITSAGTNGSKEGDWWDSETFLVGVRDKKPLVEVQSIPNDISEPVYGNTIYNKEVITNSGTVLDTKTFEKIETSYYITYPTYYEYDKKGEVVSSEFSLKKWQNSGWISIGNQTWFPQITTQNAKLCWAPGQYYGIFDWNNGASGSIRLVSYATYSSFDEYYSVVSNYPSTQGQSGRGVMIPSWRAIEYWWGETTICRGLNLISRRFISEEYDARKSGIVKVDIYYRV